MKIVDKTEEDIEVIKKEKKVRGLVKKFAKTNKLEYDDGHIYPSLKASGREIIEADFTNDIIKVYRSAYEANAKALAKQYEKQILGKDQEVTLEMSYSLEQMAREEED